VEQTSITLRSERILTPTGVTAGELRIAGGRIDAIASRVGSPTVDLGRWWIVPGFIDTHVHGGGGAHLDATDPAEIDRACRFHATHGTTALLATTVPGPIPELCAVLGAIATARQRPTGGAAVLGAHLEGPFINPARPGALDPARFLAPDRDTLGELLDAASGAVRLVTLAPELPGALDLVADLVRRDVAVSVGHTDATYAQVAAAVAAGARSATHLFNAMRGLHHREPGAVGAVLDLGELNTELIADGEHVSSPAMRVVLRAKGIDGVRLITDAIAAAGMGDGSYRLGASAVEVSGGRATVAGGATLAGSTLTMDAAVRRVVAEVGLTVEQAVALASANPARLLGLAGRKGAHAPGMDADIVVLDEDLGVRATLVGGEWVHGPFG
jgi:N-acetylglucosamine-6-phosphate deacetylase